MPESMRVAELCDFAGVQVNPRDRAAEVYLGLEHLTSGRFVISGQGTAHDVQSSKYSFRAGDVLYGKLRPYLDKAVLATDSGICTTELLVLRPKTGVDPRFLVAVMHAPNFVEHAVMGTTGVQHPRTSWDHIKDFELPWFALDDQTRIANLLWRVHDAIISNEDSVEAGADLKSAAMRELFTRGLRDESQKETEIGPVPESWTVVRLDEVCSLSTGTTPATTRADYYQGSVPFIRTAEIVNNRLTTAGTFVSAEAVKDYSLRIYPPGTILMAMYGQGKTRGKVALLGIPASTSQNAAAIQPVATLESGFLWNFFLSQYDQLRGMGSLGHLSHLNLGYLRDILIPYPPTLSEQREIVIILDAIDRKIDLHRRKRSVLDDLFKALLHKLVTGEIRVADLDLSALTATPTTDLAIA